jgi:hypothetical protein
MKPLGEVGHLGYVQAQPPQPFVIGKSVAWRFV